jgi:hypothetical protein
MMEDNDKMVLSDQPIGKEYQIPELVDLNSIGEASGFIKCINGTGNDITCDSGSGAGP